MTKINLSEEEKTKLIDLINNGSEIPLELLEKLGPGFFDKLAQEGKFDFATLEKFKVPTLEYAGKRAENVILASASLTGGNAPLQVERCFESGKVTNGKSQLTIFEESRKEDINWRNLIIQGDNLQFLKTCYVNKDPLIKNKVKDKIKLIYIDPPFGTGDEYGSDEVEMSYSAKINTTEFIESLRERLIFLRELLSKDGLIFVRLDYHFCHYIKLVLDEVFGKDRFKNEIVVSRSKYTKTAPRRFLTKTDSLFFYSKSENYQFTNIREMKPVEEQIWRPFLHLPGENKTKIFRVIEGIKFFPPPGRHWAFSQENLDKAYAKKLARINPETKKPEIKTIDTEISNNWTDIPGYTARPGGYPTENSEELLERVIKSASNTDDLVLDCFAGSGTTGAVAEKLGRRWIMCDFGKHSIYTMQKRMFRISESKKLGQEVNKNAKYEKGPMPFCVASCGGYDFTRIMYLRENKEAYIAFVLGLFNLSKTEEDYTRKYKLPNVFGEKEGNPVEVYSVWKDEYLKNVKVDREYLQEIIDQSRGKLKGDYYIIAPVSCTSVGDTVLENDKHEPVHFKILSFPYKILEEAARSFEIKEQPSSSANINDLITSVGFYFNEQVDVEVKKTSDGIQITKFKSEITDKNGKKFEGLAGLAMVLVDKDYNGKVFDMEEAVYAVDIKEDGKIAIGGITADTNVIAIDKHGNESKITAVK